MAEDVRRTGWCGFVALLIIAGCDVGTAPDAPRAERAGALRVHVVSWPLETFARRIGGDQVEVFFPAPADADPAYWSPPADIVAEFQSSDLIIENGAGFAAWTNHATLPRGARVDTSAAIRDRLLTVGDAVTHGHGPDGEHTHAATDFNVWLDMRLAREQAGAIARAFAERRPDAAPGFDARLAELEAELGLLDRRFAAAFAPLEMRPMLFSHPVYAYLARRYALRGPSLHWEPGVMPDEDEWRALEVLAADLPVAWMLFEGEPHPEVRARLAALGVRVIVFEPAGGRTEHADWLAAMAANATRVEAAVAQVPAR